MEVGRYTAEDYARFRNDWSVGAKIYDNQNIEIYPTFRSKSVPNQEFFSLQLGQNIFQ